MTLFGNCRLFSKITHFILYNKTNNGSQIANFFMKIIRLHKLFMSIVSDRNIKFIIFLEKLFGIQLNFLFAFNLQIIGQIEVVNDKGNY